MKRLLNPIVFLFACGPMTAHSATWDGGGGDDLFSSPANWVGDVLPANPQDHPIFPDSATQKQVNLGATNQFCERFILEGGYRLYNGRMLVFGGGNGAEITSTGSNTLDADYGTEIWGNDVKLIQAAGGTLTVNGSSTGFQKSIELRAQGTILVNGQVAPGGGYAFYKTGPGIARFSAGSSLTGATGGRFVTQGTLIMNATANGESSWNVDGGRIAGTGNLQSDLTVGVANGSTIAPGDPATADGVGTFSISGNVSLGNEAALEVQIGNSGVCDVLAVTGNLSLAARAALWVRVAPGATPSGNYTIVTHSGARSGQFILLDAPPGATVDYATPGQIRIVVGAPPVAENIVFPSGSGILDVTQAPYNAIPNDGLDDTVAIQAALDAFPNGRRIIYLPNGTYHISNTLNWPAGIPGWTDYKHTIMQGQSRDGVILRLPDNAAGYQDANNRKAVIFTGPAPAQRFGIAIRTLTVHTGSGNPGAAGIQFNANNFGILKSVKIVSGDGQGTFGLDMAFTAEIGPLLVQDLEVEGFDYGVRTADAINGMVLERVTVRGQRLAGIRNDGQVFTIRGFTSINSVPAFINGLNPFGGIETGGAATLLEARFIGLPGAESVEAIQSAGFLHARDVITTGYSRVLTQITINGGIQVPGATLDEYTSRTRHQQFPSPSRSLQLPIENPPAIPWDALAGWTSVVAYGADASGNSDSTAAFQAAIDAGFTTVFIPPGTFIIHGDVLLRGAVRRLTGTQTNVIGSGRIILADGTAPAVWIERAGMPAIVQQSARTLVVSNVEAASVTSNSSGKLFIEDVVSDRFQFLNPRARVWARQLNVESDGGTNVVNDGARLWIFGMKTERAQTKLETKNGGFTEVLGMHNYSTTNPGTTPLFVITDSSASFVNIAESNFSGQPYVNIVQETRGATSLVLPATDLPFRSSANGRTMSLYTGFDGSPKRPLDLAAAPSAAGITLTWSDQSWDETGFLLERSPDGTTWTSLTTLPADATNYLDISGAPATSYQYRLRSQNSLGLSASAISTARTFSPVQNWLAGFSFAPATDLKLDTDSDGLPLLLEYALGGSPTTNDTALTPAARVLGNILSINYIPLRPELTYSVETSPNLQSGSWTTAGVSLSNSGNLHTASYLFGTESRRFVRLKVVAP
jgi:hypothetical protein